MIESPPLPVEPANAAAAAKTCAGISDRRRLLLAGNSKRSPRREECQDKSMDTTTVFEDNSRMMPTVFNFNLDSPTTMEAEDGHIISSGGESSNPIPIPGCSNYLLAPAAFDSDGLTPSPMSISDQHFSDAQGRAFQSGPFFTVSKRLCVIDSRVVYIKIHIFIKIMNHEVQSQYSPKTIHSGVIAAHL